MSRNCDGESDYPFTVGNSGCALLEDDTAGHDKRILIRTIEAKEIGGSPAKFYELTQGQPVIVKGVYAYDAFLSSLTMDIMRKSFAGRVLHGYDTRRDEYAEFKAEDVFENVMQAPEDRYMAVVDHPIEADNEFGQRFAVPAFFQENWLMGHGTHDGYVKSIFFSGRDNFTAYHVDPWGMQGWMFLAQGRKYWELTPPKEQVFIFDPIMKEFYDYGKAAKLRRSQQQQASSLTSSSSSSVSSSSTSSASSPSQQELLAYESRFPHRGLASRHVGMLHAGEFMYIPPGWAHQVWTYEAGFGVGGAVYNHFALHDAVYSHLFNRSFSIEEVSLNVRALLAELDPAVQLDKYPGAREVVAEQMALIDAWEAAFVATDGTTSSKYNKTRSTDAKSTSSGSSDTSSSSICSSSSSVCSSSSSICSNSATCSSDSTSTASSSTAGAGDGV